MNYTNDETQISSAASTARSDVERSFLNKVYNWMCGGLAISGIIAWFVAGSMQHPGSIFRSQAVFIGLIIAELALVFVLSAAIRKMSPEVAAMCFIGYAALNGATLAPILLIYTGASVFNAFAVCAGTFAVTSVYGYMTKSNLSSIGSFCMMGVFGLIIAIVVNMFLRNSMFDLIISLAGVVIFVGLTAYDTQKIRRMAFAVGEESSDVERKASILGALTLYLDFINLFLYLVRLLGNRR